MVLHLGQGFVSRFINLIVFTMFFAMVSGMFMAAGIFAIFGNVIAGRLSDRFGRRPTLALAMLIHCVSVVLFYNTSGPWLPVAWMIAVFCYFAVEVIVSAISGELSSTTSAPLLLMTSMAVNMASDMTASVSVVR